MYKASLLLFLMILYGRTTYARCTFSKNSNYNKEQTNKKRGNMCDHWIDRSPLVIALNVKT